MLISVCTLRQMSNAKVSHLADLPIELPAISSPDVSLHRILVQFPSCSSSWTVEFFLQARLYTVKVLYRPALYQPTMMIPKNVPEFHPPHWPSCLSISLQDTSFPTHGLSGSAHWNHNHISLSALLNNSRSKAPSPPKLFGLLVFSQRSKQLLPVAASEPFQKTSYFIQPLN